MPYTHGNPYEAFVAAVAMIAFAGYVLVGAIALAVEGWGRFKERWAYWWGRPPA